MKKLNFGDVTDAGDAKGTSRRATFVAFRDRIETTSSTITVHSDPRFNDGMGRRDQLVLQVVTNRVSAGTGPVRLQVQIEHSADGVNWSPRPGNPVIDYTLSMHGSTFPPLAIDDGSKPSLALVRLALKLSAGSGPVSAKVRLVATCNDHRQRAFARQAEQFREAHDAGDVYYLCYPSGVPISIASFTQKEVQDLVNLHLAYANGSGGLVMTGGASCCFRADGKFIITKGGYLVYPPR